LSFTLLLTAVHFAYCILPFIKNHASYHFMNAYICLFAGDSFHFIRFASEKETLCVLFMFWSMPLLHYQSSNKLWSAFGHVSHNEPLICKTLIGKKHVIHFYTHEWPETTELQISVNCTRATPTTVYPIKSILL